jgi:hypothetical protein
MEIVWHIIFPKFEKQIPLKNHVKGLDMGKGWCRGSDEADATRVL